MVHMFLSDQPAKHFLQPVFPRLSCSGKGLGDTSFYCCKGRFNLYSNHLGPGQSWDSGGGSITRRDPQPLPLKARSKCLDNPASCAEDSTVKRRFGKKAVPEVGGSQCPGEGCPAGGWGGRPFAWISQLIETCALNNKRAIRAVSLHAGAGITHVMSKSGCLENSHIHGDTLNNKLGNVQFSQTYQCYNHFSQEKRHHTYCCTFAQSPNMFGRLLI